MSEKYDVNWAGTEKYRLPQDWALSGNNPAAGRRKIAYPEGETVEWYGFVRHNFAIEGHAAFIVEPPNPAPGLPWSWCVQWAEAFVPRTPALKLLERGFHHVHIDVFDTYMNPEGIRILEKFYQLLQELGFAAQAALIGMSYGGLFSFRWAAEHPETVAAIYADAPVCDLAFEFAGTGQKELSASEMARRAKAYGVSGKTELFEHPLSPLNRYSEIAQAQIPIFCIRNGQDQSVVPEKNIDIFADRLRQAGGLIEILNRPCYGHHPHGLDDPQLLVDFILQHYCY